MTNLDEPLDSQTLRNLEGDRVCASNKASMKLYDENCWDFVKTQDRNPMIFPIEEAIKAHSLHRSLSVKIDNQSTTRISVKGVDLTSLNVGKNVRSQTGSPRQATSLSTRKACVRLWDHSTLTPKVFLYRRGY